MIGRIPLAVLCLTFLISTQPAHAQEQAFHKIDLPLATQWASVADLNNDHIPDMVCKASSSDTVNTVALGNGDGTFHEIEHLPNGAVKFVELNKDNTIDVFVNQTVMLGDGDGTFTTKGTIPSPIVLLDDFNVDGNLDILTSTQILFGDGTGAFPTSKTISLPGGLVTSGKFTSDNIPDLLLRSNTDSTVLITVLAGDGEGNFSPHTTPSVVKSGTGTIYTGDINGDGIRDIIWGISCTEADIGSTCPCKIAAPMMFIVLGTMEADGQGGFDNWGELIFQDSFYSLVLQILDYNDDTIDDIIVSGFDRRIYSYDVLSEKYRINDILNHQDWDESCFPLMMDYNNDGNIDIVSLFSPMSGALPYFNYLGVNSVMLGRSDGTFSSESFFLEPDYWFDKDKIRVADFNNDGYPDFLHHGPNAAVFINQHLTVDVKEQKLPEIQLNQNSPNPFNPSTTITYTLASQGRVTLSVYSITGQKIATLVDGMMNAGGHAEVFDGANLASGVYFYRFESAGFSKTGKMLLMR